MLINFGDELDKVDKIRQGLLKEAPRIGIDEIDNVIRFKRNVTCFAGHANVGKTSIILYFMLLFAMKHKTKFLVFSSENEPYGIIRKLIEFKSYKPINKISSEELETPEDVIKVSKLLQKYCNAEREEKGRFFPLNGLENFDTASLF